MKKILLLVFSWLLSLCIVIRAQDCSNNYLLTKGNVCEFKHTGPDQKTAGLTRIQVLKSAQGGKDLLQATLQADVFDHKNTLLSHARYTTTCKNDSILIDIRYNLPFAVQYAPNRVLQMAALPQYIKMPRKPQTNTALPDFSTTIDERQPNGQVSNSYQLKINNRKITKTDTTTVPAGKFNCFIHTYNLSLVPTKTQTSLSSQPEMLIVTEWWDIQKGIVRSQTTNAANQLIGQTVLSRLK